MSLTLLSGPAVEPLSLAEAKLWLRVDHAEEDDLIAALTTSARLIVEATAQVLLIDQSWRIALDDWPPARLLELPLRPVRALQAVRVFAADGTSELLASAEFAFDAALHRPRLALPAGAPGPGRALAGIQIDLLVGFGAGPADVPEPLRQAMRLLVARWYERRGDAADDARRLPADVAALVAPWRRMRIA